MPESTKTLVYIDGETRSRADIKKIGGYNYIRHESTELLCFAFAVDDQPVELQRGGQGGYDGILDDLAEDPNVIFVAHNAFFERQWWQAIMVEKFGFPEIPIERWRCTMAKARSYGLPAALKNVAKALKLENQKDMEGRENMLKLSKPRSTGKKKGQFYEYEDCPEDFEKMYLYCAQDVETMRELNKRLRDLPPKELKLWQIDQRMNDRGVRVDLHCIRKALDFIERDKEFALFEFQMAVGSELKPSQREKFKAWLSKNGIEVKDTQATTIEALLEAGGLPGHVEMALELCSSGGRSATAKYNAMLTRSDADGIMRENYVYHGAHTGRWTSTGAQIQNYAKPTMDMELVCSALESLSYESFDLIFGE